MLTLYRVNIYAQNLGTILGVFLQGKREDIELRFESFLNAGATHGKLEFWTDNLALFWIHDDTLNDSVTKLWHALHYGAFNELLSTKATKGKNPWKKACRIADDRLDQIQWVNWWKAPDNVYDQFDLGDSVTAEKDTGNFDDDVVGRAVEGNGVFDIDENPARLQDRLSEESEDEEVSGVDEVGI